MKKLIGITAAVALGLGVTGCNTVNTELAKAQAVVGADVAAANAALTKIANSKGVKAVCSTIATAEGYYANVAFLIPPSAQAAEQVAAAVVAPICGGSLTGVGSALTQLANAWAVIQAATTVPKQ